MGLELPNRDVGGGGRMMRREASVSSSARQNSRSTAPDPALEVEAEG